MDGVGGWQSRVGSEASCWDLLDVRGEASPANVRSRTRPLVDARMERDSDASGAREGRGAEKRGKGGSLSEPATLIMPGVGVPTGRQT
jgi:hypothetical protein